MSTQAVTVNVTSSWVTANKKSLNDAVSAVPFSDTHRNKDGSLTDMVDLDSCVLLMRPEEENGNHDATGQPCSITLRLESSTLSMISHIVVVCEARMIEVSGAFGEYLTTVATELLDEIDDTSVFCCDLKLSQLTQECTLKFAKLTRTSDMWLYGVKVVWKTEESRQNPGLNLESVEQRLKDSRTQLSDRAKSCKQFLKMYSASNEQKKSLQGFPDPMSLLSLLPAMSRQKQARSLESSFLESATQRFKSVPSSSNHMSSESKSSADQDNSICGGCSLKFESMLERQLMSMESRIMKALDEKMAALQYHQDKQIENLVHLLSTSASDRSRGNSGGGDSVLSDQDLKIEQTIKKMMDQRNVPSYSTDDTKDENILRNALMTMRLNKMYTGTSCSNGIESSMSQVVQNSS